MHDCLFCRIIQGTIPAQRLLENDHLIAFPDINPQAPLHALIVPKRHIATLNDLQDGDQAVMGALFLAARQLAEEAGLAERGYRTLINCNAEAGQSVFHIHMHLLAGRPLGWPPG